MRGTDLLHDGCRAVPPGDRQTAIQRRYTLCGRAITGEGFADAHPACERGRASLARNGDRAGPGENTGCPFQTAEEFSQALRSGVSGFPLDAVTTAGVPSDRPATTRTVESEAAIAASAHPAPALSAVTERSKGPATITLKKSNLTPLVAGGALIVLLLIGVGGCLIRSRTPAAAPASVPAPAVAAPAPAVAPTQPASAPPARAAPEAKTAATVPSTAAPKTTSSQAPSPGPVTTRRGTNARPGVSAWRRGCWGGVGRRRHVFSSRRTNFGGRRDVSASRPDRSRRRNRSAGRVRQCEDVGSQGDQGG